MAVGQYTRLVGTAKYKPRPAIPDARVSSAGRTVARQTPEIQQQIDIESDQCKREPHGGYRPVKSKVPGGANLNPHAEQTDGTRTITKTPSDTNATLMKSDHAVGQFAVSSRSKHLANWPERFQSFPHQTQHHHGNGRAHPGQVGSFVRGTVAIAISPGSKPQDYNRRAALARHGALHPWPPLQRIADCKCGPITVRTCAGDAGGRLSYFHALGEPWCPPELVVNSPHVLE